MALVLADRVRDTTTTTGTGTVTLSGTAPTGYQTFGAAIGNGNTTYYTINAGSQWEVGLGTYSSTGPTLARTTVLSSSNGGSLVDFSTGTKDVFVTYPAEKSVNYDASDNVGIGTSSPGVLLDVFSAAGPIIKNRSSTVNTTLRGFEIQTVNDIHASFKAEPSSGELRIASGFSTWGGYQTFYTNGSERMRISSAGNVGVGTSSPTDLLTVANGSIASIISGSGANLQMGRIAMYSSALGAAYTNYGGEIRSYSGAGIDVSDLRFYTANGAATAERMRITNTGSVGIGTSSPSYLLHLNQNGNTQAWISATNSGSNSAGIGFENQGQRNWQIWADRTTDTLSFGQNSRASNYMSISGNGLVGIGTSSPFDKLHVDGNTLLSWGADNKFWMAFSNDYRMGMRLSSDTRSATIFATGPAGDGGSIRFNTRAATASGATDYGLERMVIDSSGNVSIGTTTGLARLRVSAPASVNAPVLGNVTNYPAFFSNADPAYGLGIGTNGGDGHVWLQAQRSDSATAYNLTLQEAGGNVGIGTSSPAFKTDVVGDIHASSSVFTGSNTDGWGRFINSGGALYIQAGSLNSGAATAQPIIFTNMYGGSERMRIDGAGLVSINTTATLAQLTVAGTGGSGQVAGFRNTIYLRNNNTSGNQSNFISFGSAGTVSSCFIGNDIQGDGTTINQLNVQAGASGGVYLASGGTSWTSASDERGKDIIEPISNAAQKVSTLRAVIGKYKTDAEGTRRSFLIAQDVQAVLPEAVNVGTDDQQTLGVAYTDTIPLLVAAIKELTARVAQLEGN